jgi:DNA modification methylase
MQINWTTEKRKVADLKHWEENPRKITPEKLEELKDKIKERGFHDVIKLDENGMILSGNMRKEALEQLGIQEVNVLVPDRELTTEEKILVGIESNIQAGEFDKDILKSFGTDILLKSGLSDEELSEMFNNVETVNDEFDEEKAVEIASKNVTVKPGELYQLGDHRLMCGDCLKEEDVAKLMGEEKANVVYADPPYNIGLDYDKGVGNKVGHYGGGHSAKIDSKSDMDYTEFIRKSIQNSINVSEKNAHIFYWCDERYIWIIQTIFEELGISNKRVCLWIKNNASPTPQVAFNKVYEPCVYGTKGRPYLNKEFRATNEIMNREIGTGNQLVEDILAIINLWIANRDNTQDYKHPTQKPITLHEKPLKRCSKPGDVIYDGFGGSGSTLIACEQMKRKAFIMELDPVFCQVIINRWEGMTGLKAKLLS